jgi:hypothetical protein
MTSARLDVKAVFLLSLSAFVVWLACGLTMGLGRSAFGLETALKVHAIAAPVYAALVSLVYFERFHAVSPLVAAAFVTVIIVVLDAGVVVAVFEKSYAMFSSILGTWLPFLSIFVATYLTGTIVRHSSPEAPAADLRR